jgi:23S rRNA (uridine2552-2'-O)-methyltransferase
LEILQKYNIKAKYALDLGSAPGGWSQVLQEFSKVVAIDQVPMDPLTNVEFIHGKIQDQFVQDQLQNMNIKWDLITSDMSPSFSGNHTVDISRSFELVQMALDQCSKLKTDGSLIVKFFQGNGEAEIKSKLSLSFRKVVHFKPKSSRSGSREGYWICMGFKNPTLA